MGESEQQSNEMGAPFRPVPLLTLIHLYPEKKQQLNRDVRKPEGIRLKHF